MGLPQGWLCRQPVDAAQGTAPIGGGLRTCTNCSGNGFGDKIAHRVEVQTPQPKLRTGLQEAQRQPSANWARTQIAGFDMHSGKPDQLLHSATGLSTQGRSVTHQLPNAIDCRNNRCTLRWASFGLAATSRSDSNRFTESRLNLLATAFSSAHPWEPGL